MHGAKLNNFSHFVSSPVSGNLPQTAFCTRIVTVDHYQSFPIKDFDVCYSDFRGCEAYKVPVIRIFGVTPAGQKSCLHVHNVFPYISIVCDEHMPNSESNSRFWKYMQELALNIDKALNTASANSTSQKQHVYKISLISGIPFYGYHGKEQLFLRIYFYTPNVTKKAAELLAAGAIMNKVMQPHEAHIPYILQFFIDYNLFGMNLIKISDLKFRETSNAVSSPSSSTSSDTNINSLSFKIWRVEDMNSSMWCSKVKKQTYCEIEADCSAIRIVNRFEEQLHQMRNPGLQAIWDDERQRRLQNEELLRLTPAVSQERGNVKLSESELNYKQKLKEILSKFEEFSVFKPEQKGESQTSPGNVMSTLVSSQKPSNQSFCDSQDKEMLGIFMNLAKSQALDADQDSILGVPETYDDELDAEDAAVTLEMSQCLDDDEAEDYPADTTKQSSGDSDSSSPLCSSAQSRIVIPQLDGAGDDENSDLEKNSHLDLPPPQQANSESSTCSNGTIIKDHQEQKPALKLSLSKKGRRKLSVPHSSSFPMKNKQESENIPNENHNMQNQCGFPKSASSDVLYVPFVKSETGKESDKKQLCNVDDPSRKITRLSLKKYRKVLLNKSSSAHAINVRRSSLPVRENKEDHSKDVNMYNIRNASVVLTKLSEMEVQNLSHNVSNNYTSCPVAKTNPSSPSLKMKFKLQHNSSPAEDPYFMVLNPNISKSSQHELMHKPLKLKLKLTGSQEVEKVPDSSADSSTNSYKQVRPLIRRLTSHQRNKNNPQYKSPLLMENSESSQAFHVHENKNKLNLVIKKKVECDTKKNAVLEEHPADIQERKLSRLNLILTRNKDDGFKCISSPEKCEPEPSFSCNSLKIHFRKRNFGSSNCTQSDNATPYEILRKPDFNVMDASLNSSNSETIQRLPKLHLKLNSQDNWTTCNVVPDVVEVDSKLATSTCSNTKLKCPKKTPAFVLPMCSPKKNPRLTANEGFLTENPNVSSPTGKNSTQNLLLLCRPASVVITKISDKEIKQYAVCNKENDQSKLSPIAQEHACGVNENNDLSGISSDTALLDESPGSPFVTNNAMWTLSYFSPCESDHGSTSPPYCWSPTPENCTSQFNPDLQEQISLNTPVCMDQSKFKIKTEPGLTAAGENKCNMQNSNASKNSFNLDTVDFSEELKSPSSIAEIKKEDFKVLVSEYSLNSPDSSSSPISCINFTGEKMHVPSKFKPCLNDPLEYPSIQQSNVYNSSNVEPSLLDVQLGNSNTSFCSPKDTTSPTQCELLTSEAPASFHNLEPLAIDNENKNVDLKNFLMSVKSDNFDVLRSTQLSFYSTLDEDEPTFPFNYDVNKDDKLSFACGTAESKDSLDLSADLFASGDISFGLYSQASIPSSSEPDAKCSKQDIQTGQKNSSNLCLEKDAIFSAGHTENHFDKNMVSAMEIKSATSDSPAPNPESLLSQNENNFETPLFDPNLHLEQQTNQHDSPFPTTASQISSSIITSDLSGNNISRCTKSDEKISLTTFIPDKLIDNIVSQKSDFKELVTGEQVSNENFLSNPPVPLNTFNSKSYAFSVPAVQCQNQAPKNFSTDNKPVQLSSSDDGGGGGGDLLSKIVKSCNIDVEFDCFVDDCPEGNQNNNTNMTQLYGAPILQYGNIYTQNSPLINYHCSPIPCVLTSPITKSALNNCNILERKKCQTFVPAVKIKQELKSPQVNDSYSEHNNTALSVGSDVCSFYGGDETAYINMSLDMSVGRAPQQITSSNCNHLTMEPFSIAPYAQSSGQLDQPKVIFAAKHSVGSPKTVSRNSPRKKKLTSSLVWVPQMKPPSKVEASASAHLYDLSEIKPQTPFFSDPTDEAVDPTDFKRWGIGTHKMQDLKDFGSPFHENRTAQQSTTSRCDLTDGLQISSSLHLKLPINKNRVLVPSVLPPSAKDVEKWLKGSSGAATSTPSVHLKVEDGKSLQIVSRQSNASSDQAGEIQKFPTLSKLLGSPTLSVKKPNLKFLYGEERSSSAPCFSTPISVKLNGKRTIPGPQLKDIESRLLLSPVSSKEISVQKKRKLDYQGAVTDELDVKMQSKLECNNSNMNVPVNPILLNTTINSSTSEIEGPTLENSGAFKVNLGNIQDSHANHEYQHLSLISLEVHVNTRNNLRPNPEHDPVSVIFFCIQKDSKEDNSKKIGIIAIDETSLGHPTSTSRYPKELRAASGVSQDLIFCVQNENQLFEQLVVTVRDFDPDIFVGYEIELLSWGYLLQRASFLNIDLHSKLSRLIEKQNVASNKLPWEEHPDYVSDKSYDLHIGGRVVLNLWRLMRKEVTLNVYTFENVYYHVMHRRKPMYNFQTLTTWFQNRQSPVRWRVIEYYISHILGNIQLLESLNVIQKTSELARVFGIQFFEVLSRGSQFRVESMMLRAAKSYRYISVSPTIQQRSRARAPEYIPLIFEPESKFYVDPVIVLDFQSLYPSMVIAYNYCFSTCLGRVDNFGKSMPFQFGCTTLDVSVDLLKKIINDIHISPAGVAFVTSNIRRGILPLMLDDILNTRIMVKQSLKLSKSNVYLSRLLDARQLALKLIANVTYGYTSANFSGRMPCVEVADSIVGKGRETLENAIRLIEQSPRWKAKVVYGDTDSVFVLLPGRSKEQAFKIGQEIADAVTAMNPKPVKLKFEKVYLPCVLQTKKRYVGYMYETLDQKEPIFDAKGIETVRRDSCAAVGKMLEKTLKLLFDKRDISQVKKYVQKQFEKLLSGKASIMDCIFAKEYRGRSGYRPGSCVPALEIAKKRLLVDPRSEPRVGERVPYVVVYGFPGLPIIQLVREPEELLMDSSLKINAKYYITRVICPPLNRVFSLIGVDVMHWYTSISHSFVPSLPIVPSTSKSKGTLSQYFTATNCPACENTSNNGLCNSCQNDPQSTAVILNNKIRHWERTAHHLSQICKSCTKSAGCVDFCTSLDCPILFKLNSAHKDLAQTPHFRNILFHKLF